MIDHSAARQHRRRGHARLIQRFQPFRRPSFQQRFLDQGQPRVGIGVPERRGLEPRVVDQVVPAAGDAESRPLCIRHGRYADVVVLGLVDQVDEGGGAADADLPADKGLAAHVRCPEKGDHGFEHRDLYMLALTGLGTPGERRRHRLRRCHGCQLVGNDGANEARSFLVGTRLDRGEAGERLNDRVVDGLVGKRPVFAPAAHGDVDQVRLDSAKVGFADPKSLADAGAEVLDEHVRRFDQLLDRRQPGRRLDVDGDRALVAIVVEVGAAHAFWAGAGAPGMIRPSGRFDLDDVGPLVRQDHRRERTRDDIGHVDDPVAC